MASNTQYYNLLPIVLVLLLLICDSAALKFLKKTQGMTLRRDRYNSAAVIIAT